MMTQPMTKSRARCAALLSGVALVVGIGAVCAPGIAAAQAEQSGIVGRIVVARREAVPGPGSGAG